MRTTSLGVFGAALLLGCGGKGSFGFESGIDDDAGLGDDSGECDPVSGCFETDGAPQEAAPPCVGLKCQQVACGGGTTTTVSGKVFAPNGTLPLYNVIVYVPNAALDPIVNGAICDKCGAVVSGSPVVTALTDSSGKFVLKDVPAGSNIPLVVQVGKWRRKYTIPQVTQCVDNPIKDGTYRLPKNRTEGDMPRIAMVTGGCDALACILSKVGIDTAEFGDSSGGPHKVVWYNGISGSAPGSPQPATALWPNLAELKKFDIVINSCECSENNQEKTSPQILQQYADQGGRVFGSHFHYTWQRNLIAAWKPTAAWQGGGSSTTPDLVDMSFPKGKALAEWLISPAVGASSTLGQIPLQVKTLNVADVNAPTTRWIMASGGPPTTTHYLSFNTPVGLQPDKQCGKVVYAGLHVSSQGSVGPTFPAACGQTFTPDEKALTFLFFDLSSCVTDETKPPEPPPVPQ